jgi:hypothetical protein
MEMDKKKDEKCFQYYLYGHIHFKISKWIFLEMKRIFGSCILFILW